MLTAHGAEVDYFILPLACRKKSKGLIKVKLSRNRISNSVKQRKSVTNNFLSEINAYDVLLRNPPWIRKLGSELKLL